jgi:hypothetical protein
MLISTQLSLAATPIYGGYQTTNWKGIDGYLRQSTTVSTTAVHFVWITICGHSDCTHWTQTGTYQGDFAGGSSETAVHIYYENVDACGSYFKDDLGAPPSADYPYYIKRNAAGVHTIICPGGMPRSAYTYEYRKGSLANSPFFLGNLGTDDGLAMAKTEIQGSPPINTDYFGCTSTFDCSTGSFGLHLFNGTSWSLWTGSSTASHGNPPYLHTYNSFWAFRTCPNSC